MSICFHDHDLLGFTWAGQKLLFHGSDSKELYEQNLRKQPSDWYYRTHTITYNYNKQGHRCKELRDVDLNNYILFAGDSNTEGMGLELETTHPYITAKKLNISYYNLALGGTGMDAVFYNLQTWLCKFPKPKYVVICLSEPVRFLAKVKSNTTVFRGYGPHVDQTNVKQFLSTGDEVGYFDARMMMYANMLSNLLQNIPHNFISVIDWQVPYIDHKIFNYYGNKDSDTVRDLMHPGINVNSVISDYLVEQYTTKYSNATVHSTIRGQN